MENENMEQDKSIDQDKSASAQGNPYEGMSAEQIWEKLYAKPLDCKKNILDYVEAIKTLKKAKATEGQLAETYNYIYDRIEAMKDGIKPNTMMFLKNALKAQLGKYVKDKDPKPANEFIEFLKKAYPDNYRRSDFTRALMDMNHLNQEQIWTTLVYINRECLNSGLKLNAAQRADVIDVVKKAVGKNDVKFNNKIKSLQTLVQELRITIENVGQIYSVKVR